MFALLLKNIRNAFLRPLERLKMQFFTFGVTLTLTISFWSSTLTDTPQALDKNYKLYWEYGNTIIKTTLGKDHSVSESDINFQIRAK